MPSAPYKIDLNELKQEVLKIAKERPDFKYRDQEGALPASCSYVGAKVGTKGGEGCILGQALMRLGVPEMSLRMWEFQNSGVERNTGIRSLVMDESVITCEFDWDILIDLADVQHRQDFGDSWSQAVRDL